MNCPVAALAILSATSIASEPPVVNRAFGQGPWRDGCELLGQLDGRLAGEAPGREGQVVELPPDRLLQTRMPVPDVVHVVAMESM